nr:hypothetical protein 9 [Candidatus Aminicenantes bacterium]
MEKDKEVLEKYLKLEDPKIIFKEIVQIPNDLRRGTYIDIADIFFKNGILTSLLPKKLIGDAIQSRTSQVLNLKLYENEELNLADRNENDWFIFFASVIYKLNNNLINITTPFPDNFDYFKELIKLYINVYKNELESNKIKDYYLIKELLDDLNGGNNENIFKNVFSNNLENPLLDNSSPTKIIKSIIIILIRLTDIDEGRDNRISNDIFISDDKGLKIGFTEIYDILRLWYINEEKSFLSLYLEFLGYKPLWYKELREKRRHRKFWNFNGQNKTIVLIGAPRSGKTAFMFATEKELELEQKNDLKWCGAGEDKSYELRTKWKENKLERSETSEVYLTLKDNIIQWTVFDAKGEASAGAKIELGAAGEIERNLNLCRPSAFIILIDAEDKDLISLSDKYGDNIEDDGILAYESMQRVMIQVLGNTNPAEIPIIFLFNKYDLWGSKSIDDSSDPFFEITPQIVDQYKSKNELIMDHAISREKTKNKWKHLNFSSVLKRYRSNNFNVFLSSLIQVGFIHFSGFLTSASVNTYGIDNVWNYLNHLYRDRVRQTDEFTINKHDFSILDYKKSLISHLKDTLDAQSRIKNQLKDLEIEWNKINAIKKELLNIFKFDIPGLKNSKDELKIEFDSIWKSGCLNGKLLKQKNDVKNGIDIIYKEMIENLNAIFHEKNITYSDNRSKSENDWNEWAIGIISGNWFLENSWNIYKKKITELKRSSFSLINDILIQLSIPFNRTLKDIHLRIIESLGKVNKDFEFFYRKLEDGDIRYDEFNGSIETGCTMADRIDIWPYTENGISNTPVYPDNSVLNGEIKWSINDLWKSDNEAFIIEALNYYSGVSVLFEENNRITSFSFIPRNNLDKERNNVRLATKKKTKKMYNILIDCYLYVASILRSLTELEDNLELILRKKQEKWLREIIKKPVIFGYGWQEEVNDSEDLKIIMRKVNRVINQLDKKGIRTLIRSIMSRKLSVEESGEVDNWDIEPKYRNPVSIKNYLNWIKLIIYPLAYLKELDNEEPELNFHEFELPSLNEWELVIRPIIVSQIAEYLLLKGWNIDKPVMQNIRDFAGKVNLSTYYRIDNNSPKKNSIEIVNCVKEIVDTIERYIN